MKVFTVQPLEVLDIIEKKGYFTCEKAKSENYKDFYDAYNWLAKEMIRRKIYPVENNTLPVWCWYLYDGKNKLDLRHSGLGTPKEKQVCLELEIQENKILLSDYGAWHFVLNNSWYDDSTSEREFDKLHDWFDTLPYQKQEEFIRNIVTFATRWDVCCVVVLHPKKMDMYRKMSIFDLQE